MHQPFFVTGSGRSGSTLLYRMLDQHEQIALTNEGHVADFLSFVLRFAGTPQKAEEEFVIHRPVTLRGIVRADCREALGQVLSRHARGILEEFYGEHFADRKFTHWGDKLPSPEVCVELQEILPIAKFIKLVRDPRAICSSLLAMSEKDLPASDLIQAIDLEELASSIQNVYTGLEQYLQQQITIRYEELATDPRANLRKVLDYLGLAGADEVYGRYQELHPLTTHATTPSVEASLTAWRDRLTDEQRSVIEERCAEMLKTYGYA